MHFFEKMYFLKYFRKIKIPFKVHKITVPFLHVVFLHIEINTNPIDVSDNLVFDECDVQKGVVSLVLAISDFTCCALRAQVLKV